MQRLIDQKCRPYLIFFKKLLVEYKANENDEEVQKERQEVQAQFTEAMKELDSEVQGDEIRSPEGLFRIAEVAFIVEREKDVSIN